MQSIDFYKLPRSSQERFVGSVTGAGLPKPIVYALTKPLAPTAWVGVSGVAFLVLLALLGVGYGSLESHLGREGAPFLVADVLLASLVVLALLRASSKRHGHARSPFRPGVYVFPVGLIDARTPLLGVYPIEDLSGVFGPDVRGLTLAFGAKSFSFPVHDATRVASVKEELERGGTAMSTAGAARESVRPKALAPLDPLQGYANPLSSPNQLAPSTQSWAALTIPIAIALGVVVGGGLWGIRNLTSDNAMFARAQAANDTATFRAYLERGTRHADEVSTRLLPRALLRDAESVGTVEAIEQFIQEHPQPEVARAAALARKTALLHELDVAVKAGDLAPLDAFSQRHPKAGVDAEVAAARHHIYQTAFDRYAATAPDKAAASFVQRLLAWSEAHGPKVEMRFRGRRSRSMDKADRSAGQSRQFKGVISLPSRYFDDVAEKGDMDAFAAGISARFAEALPKELLSIELGAPLADTEAPLPPRVALPTLFIDHGSAWAGAIQASLKPRGVFIGLELSFDALFRMPDEASPVKIRTDGWFMPGLLAAKDADKPEEAIYNAMRATAFEQFERKLLGAFFPHATK